MTEPINKIMKITSPEINVINGELLLIIEANNCAIYGDTNVPMLATAVIIDAVNAICSGATNALIVVIKDAIKMETAIPAKLIPIALKMIEFEIINNR